MRKGRFKGEKSSDKFMITIQEMILMLDDKQILLDILQTTKNRIKEIEEE